MRRRLFWQIFWGFSLVTVVSTAAIGVLAWLTYDRLETDEAVRPVADFIVETLRLDGAAFEASRAAGLKRAHELGLDLAIYSPEGEPILATREGLPTPHERGFEPGFIHHDARPGYIIDLPDGRWFAAVRRTPSLHPAKRFLVPLAIFLLVALAGCMLLARRITRRLEALERRVTNWGEGDLDARAPGLGVDEIGRLALRFNAAADRIAELIDAHKTVVAHASHELRTPLARLRLAMELMAEAETPAERAGMLAGAERDIEELDGLVEEFLLRSKIEARGRAAPDQVVELVALARAQVAHLGLAEVTVTGEPVTVTGDPRLLARALRNVLDNARKYGGDHVEVILTTDPSGVRIAVEDDGPGVPASDREHIFEPFVQRQGATGGVGLGLALVKEIARYHGGDARYEERSPVGSRFVVELPSPAPLGPGMERSPLGDADPS